jgi:general secretion pathway protein D
LGAAILKEYVSAPTDPAAPKDAPGQKPPVLILPDEGSNALLIRGPPEVQAEIRALIAEIDGERPQVLVEAIIAEVSEETTKTFGIELAGAIPGALLFSDFPSTLGISIESALLSLLGDTDDVAGILPEGLTTGGAVISDGEVKFLGILRALSSDSKTNILSTPSLVTLDHQEAEISVGQEVPFITGNFTTDAGGGGGNIGNPFQTLERKDVGLTLRLTPHVLDNNQVELNIYQEVSSLAPATVAADVITNKRTIETVVVVGSDQVIGLGGLIDERNTDSVQKVPILGDLPLVGAAFRGTSTRRNKQNLMVFIRTQILPEVALLRAVSEQRFAEMRRLRAETLNGKDKRSKTKVKVEINESAEPVEIAPPFTDDPEDDTPYRDKFGPRR